MLTNAELLQRLRSLHEQVPEGEWVPSGGGYFWEVLRRGDRLRHTYTKEENELACLLRNHVPQILEALEQVEGENRCEKS